MFSVHNIGGGGDYSRKGTFWGGVGAGRGSGSRGVAAGRGVGAGE